MKLNNYLANIAVNYVKLHNLHWNVYGETFKEAHEYLEELYDDMAEKFDAVAELDRMQGNYPAASVKEYLELATIEELDSKAVSVKDAYTIALNDFNTLKANALELRENAGDNFGLANMMEDHLADYAKVLWFLGEKVR